MIRKKGNWRDEFDQRGLGSMNVGSDGLMGRVVRGSSVWE